MAQRRGLPAPPGPFIRAAREATEYRRELIVGQWGLIPWFAKSPKLIYSTNNARSEELAAKATFKAPWTRGQRCIIRANSFDEPNWESGKNQWWTFRRKDGAPWGFAGLWNRHELVRALGSAVAERVARYQLHVAVDRSEGGAVAQPESRVNIDGAFFCLAPTIGQISSTCTFVIVRLRMTQSW